MSKQLTGSIGNDGRSVAGDPAHSVQTLVAVGDDGGESINLTGADELSPGVCLGDNLGEGVEHFELLLAASKWVSQIPEGHLEKVPAGSPNILSKWTGAFRLLFIMLNPLSDTGILRAFRDPPRIRGRRAPYGCSSRSSRSHGTESACPGPDLSLLCNRYSAVVLQVGGRGDRR